MCGWRRWTGRPRATLWFRFRATAESIEAWRESSAPWRWPISRTSSSRRPTANGWFRCPRVPVIWGSFSRGGRLRGRWNWRCGGRTRNCGSTLPPRWKRSGLRFRRDEVGGQLRTLAEEVLVHLFEEKFLGLRGAEVEPVLVHEHLHVLDPHLPRVLGDAVKDLLPQRMAFERDFVQSFHLPLELHAKDLPRAWPDGIVDLIKTASTASTSHAFRILLSAASYAPRPGALLARQRTCAKV